MPASLAAGHQIKTVATVTGSSSPTTSCVKAAPKSQKSIPTPSSGVTGRPLPAYGPDIRHEGARAIVPTNVGRGLSDDSGLKCLWMGMPAVEHGTALNGLPLSPRPV